MVLRRSTSAVCYLYCVLLICCLERVLLQCHGLQLWANNPPADLGFLCLPAIAETFMTDVFLPREDLKTCSHHQFAVSTTGPLERATLLLRDHTSSKHRENEDFHLT